MCISRCYSKTGDPKALEIIDIVSNEGDLFQVQFPCSREVAQRLSFVANTLLNGNSQFSTTCRHDEVRFGRKHRCLQAIVLQTLNTKAVRPAAAHGFAARLVNVDLVIGKDSVEIEDEKSNLFENRT